MKTGNSDTCTADGTDDADKGDEDSEKVKSGSGEKEERQCPFDNASTRMEMFFLTIR